MARPLRIEFSGAWYHVMNRGLGRRNIFDSDSDRLVFLELLGEITETFKVEIHAYSLMGNHYHLIVHTPRGNLSQAMQYLNALYAQKVNQCYQSNRIVLKNQNNLVSITSKLSNLHSINSKIIIVLVTFLKLKQ